MASEGLPNGRPLITELRPQDVVSGRGNGLKNPGNILFSRLVRQRKQAYHETRKRHIKQELADEVYNLVQQMGGRFVEHVVTDIVPGICWCELSRSTALEKCKQSLRNRTEQSADHPSSDYIPFDSPLVSAASQVLPLPAAGTHLSKPWVVGNGFPPQLSNTDPYVTLGHAMNPLRGAVITRPEYANPFQFQQHFICQSSILRSDLSNFSGLQGVSDHSHAFHKLVLLQALERSRSVPAIPPVYPSYLEDPTDHVSKNVQIAPLGRQKSAQGVGTSQEAHIARPSYGATETSASIGIENKTYETGQSESKRRNTGEAGLNASAVNESLFMSGEGDELGETSEADAAAFVLSLLQGEQPTMTDEEMQVEQAALSEEEKMMAATDLFGKCSIRHSKKARKGLDQMSIQLRLAEMRLKIESIPSDEKRSLIEAQSKCHPEDLSDARLEQFLWCEDMDVNVRIGILRCAYHVYRIKNSSHPFLCWLKFAAGSAAVSELLGSSPGSFGPDRYLERMTLRGALRDDLVALGTGFCRFLPRLDLSGRQLFLMRPCLHTREGYTTESMVSAVCFSCESVLEKNH